MAGEAAVQPRSSAELGVLLVFVAERARVGDRRVEVLLSGFVDVLRVGGEGGGSGQGEEDCDQVFHGCFLSGWLGVCAAGTTLPNPRSAAISGTARAVTCATPDRSPRPCRSRRARTAQPRRRAARRRR